jgi:chromosome segregation ATPase
MTDSLQKELKEMTALKIKAEAKIKILESEYRQREVDHSKNYLDNHLEKFKEESRSALDAADFEKLTLKSRLNELNEFASMKTEVDEKMRDLEEELKKEKEEHKKDVEELTRERIKAVEKLKKDMLYKINETRQNLFALDDERLHTTTKLTMLENHRLTTELEYQSQQTEKLMSKKEELEAQVTSLKRDIDIHKQVESELAKRSHFCQNLIKKLNQRIRELETEVSGTKKIQGNEEEKQKHEGRLTDDLVGFLEQKLEDTMNRLAQLQMDYNMLKSENSDVKTKLQDKSHKYENLAVLLADYLNDLKILDKNLIDETDIDIDISAM